MTITTNRIGVWGLDDIYKKALSGYNTTNQLWSWGCNYRGQLGVGDTIHRSSPVQIPGCNWICGVTGSASFALKSDNTLWAWGSSSWFEQGTGDGISRCSPVQIPGNNWVDIVFGGRTILGNTTSSFRGHAAARKSDNTLWVWGRGYDGALGLGDVNHRSSPTQIPGAAWCSISVGDGYMLALKTDGTLWAWGNNGTNAQRGNLGTNNIISRSSPVQVPGNSWTAVSAGSTTSTALKSDGTLWSWGYGDSGLNGDNTTIHRSSPVQVPGTAWVEIVSSGVDTTSVVAARKSDNTLWTWGCSTIGSLGDGTNGINRSSPVQIPGTQWTDLICGNSGRGKLVIKSDCTLWGWGCNAEGQLAQNNLIHRSSPVQIPGIWSSGWHGGGSVFGFKCTT